jgi:hypothetical protein
MQSVRAEAKLYFSRHLSKKISDHAGFLQKNPAKNNFSSLLLLRPKIVKVSLVDGLLGCS